MVRNRRESRRRIRRDQEEGFGGRGSEEDDDDDHEDQDESGSSEDGGHKGHGSESTKKMVRSLRGFDVFMWLLAQGNEENVFIKRNVYCQVVK